MKRMKQVRLIFAESLVHGSPLRIGEIAERVGYTRVHEFSRDYHRQFGRPPKQDSGKNWNWYCTGQPPR